MVFVWLFSSVAVSTCYHYSPDVQQLTFAEEYLRNGSYLWFILYFLFFFVFGVVVGMFLECTDKYPHHPLKAFVYWLVVLVCIVMLTAVPAMTFASSWTPPPNLRSSQSTDSPDSPHPTPTSIATTTVTISVPPTPPVLPKCKEIDWDSANEVELRYLQVLKYKDERGKLKKLKLIVCTVNNCPLCLAFQLFLTVIKSVSQRATVVA